MTIPSAMYSLGAAPGALNVVGWGALSTYVGVVQGNFRNRHPRCHSIADMAEIVGGRALQEVTSVLFVATWIIAAASCVSGASTALNTLSENAICTNYFSLIAMFCMIIMSSIRKFGNLSWLTWVGFACVFTAVLIVVIGVTLNDRPAAAPQTGDFELGYHAFNNPSFIEGISASVTIFAAGAGTSAFLPIISEMRDPRDYKKSLYVSMFIMNACYLTFSLVVYRWCGQWVASPSLGSAGPTLKKVSYGIALFGLLVTGCLYVCSVPTGIMIPAAPCFGSNIYSLTGPRLREIHLRPHPQKLEALTGEHASTLGNMDGLHRYTVDYRVPDSLGRAHLQLHPGSRGEPWVRAHCPGSAGLDLVVRPRGLANRIPDEGGRVLPALAHGADRLLHVCWRNLWHHPVGGRRLCGGDRWFCLLVCGQ